MWLHCLVDTPDHVESTQNSKQLNRKKKWNAMQCNAMQFWPSKSPLCYIIQQETFLWHMAYLFSSKNIFALPIVSSLVTLCKPISDQHVNDSQENNRERYRHLDWNSFVRRLVWTQAKGYSEMDLLISLVLMCSWESGRYLETGSPSPSQALRGHGTRKNLHVPE